MPRRPLLRALCLLAILPPLTGCHQTESPSPFKALYTELQAQTPTSHETKADDPCLTISADSMPLTGFLRWITNETNTSIICDKDLDDAPVTIDVIDTPLPYILTAVARRLGVDLTQQGHLYYLGTVKSEDRGVLVRQVKRLTADDLKQSVDVQLSEMGKAATYDDGLLVVSDRVRVLQRIDQMLTQIEAATSTVWLLQMHILKSTDQFNHDLGLTTETTLELASSFANHATTSTATGALSAVLNAAQSSTCAQLIAQPTLLLLDGGQATIKDGTTTPIPKKTVSDNGTVTTSGYDEYETGLTITATIREMSASTARFTLDLSNTTITSYVEEVPVVTGQSFATTTVIESGGAYLLGSLTQNSTLKTTSGSLLPTLFGKENTKTDMQIWLHCIRIGSPISERTPFND